MNVLDTVRNAVILVSCAPVAACLPPADDGPGMATDGTSGTGTTGEPGACPALLDDLSGLPETVHGAPVEEVDQDTVWAAADSPHVVDGVVRVRAGATLTVEPCAVVLMGEGAQIAVEEGTLAAQGTADAPILFDRRDGGRWGYLLAEEAGVVRLAHATLRGGGSDSVTYDGATVVGDGPTGGPYVENVFVQNVTVEDSAGYGIFMRRYAAFAPGSENLTIRGAGADLVQQAPRPLRIDVMAAGTIPTGTYTGNAVDEIELDPELEVVQDTTIPNRGVPYLVGGGGGITVARQVDDPGPVPVLTIEPGVTLRFPNVPNSSALTVGGNANPPRPGSLVAMGTAEAPIVFTSAEPEPAPGDWIGIMLPAGAGTPDSEVRLDHVEIAYAGAENGVGGYACHSEDPSGNVLDEVGAVTIFGWAPAASFLTNSTIEQSAGWGVFRGWSLDEGPDVDFTPTNTFSNLAYCEQNRIWDMCPNPDVYDCVGTI